MRVNNGGVMKKQIIVICVLIILIAVFHIVFYSTPDPRELLEEAAPIRTHPYGDSITIKATDLTLYHAYSVSVRICNYSDYWLFINNIKMEIFSAEHWRILPTTNYNSIFNGKIMSMGMSIFQEPLSISEYKFSLAEYAPIASGLYRIRMNFYKMPPPPPQENENLSFTLTSEQIRRSSYDLIAEFYWPNN